ncbi:ABC transporter ATP-binding protein [Xylanimonas oleitrophica]|uniref:ABC-type quaternary amine transporter n=1 Tax=Xylanimonas oleitrophica TaxID=2607479 RepID=A0A2W5WN48_9MICO|nr:ABC transporter ATP-binding protein [Xylanimonas oleitrophica]PZR52173.1 ABC transporter ATP-binding protein [Xylanimonas oleitrophica]
MGLEVRDVVVRYAGATADAVAGVDLDVADGEILALLGPSGCGKSSLLRAVAGLEPLARGQVRYDGADLAGVPVHRRGFGLLFQEGQLFAHRDVGRNVAYGLETARVPRAERTARVRELLDAVGLAGYERRPVTTLSGGERQRVALARALAPRPRLLLLDEPFSALDRGLRERLAVEVREVLKATGTTAVFVTHDHDEAFTVADRVGVMQAGRLLQVAPPEELWRRPASRAVARFLGYQAFVPRADGGLLAVGPTGLRAAPEGSGAPGGPGEPGEPGAPATWAEVVGSAFRRGRTEITVEADLGSGRRRLVALADGVSAPAPGTKVAVTLDPAGCAVVPD